VFDLLPFYLYAAPTAQSIIALTKTGLCRSYWGFQHIDGPLQVKYWGVRPPATFAALTPMTTGLQASMRWRNNDSCIVPCRQYLTHALWTAQRWPIFMHNEYSSSRSRDIDIGHNKSDSIIPVAHDQETSRLVQETCTSVMLSCAVFFTAKSFFASNKTQPYSTQSFSLYSLNNVPNEALPGGSGLAS